MVIIAVIKQSLIFILLQQIHFSFPDWIFLLPVFIDYSNLEFRFRIDLKYTADRFVTERTASLKRMLFNLLH